MDRVGAAYELATPGTLQYLGASDDFSKGIDESKLAPFEFDCFDLTLYNTSTGLMTDPFALAASASLICSIGNTVISSW